MKRSALVLTVVFLAGYCVAEVASSASKAVEGRPGYVDCGTAYSFVALFNNPHPAPSETTNHIASGEPVAILSEADGFTEVRTQTNHQGFVNAALVHSGAPGSVSLSSLPSTTTAPVGAPANINATSQASEGRPGYVDCGTGYSFAALFSSPEPSPLETADHLSCGEAVTVLDEIGRYKEVQTQANRQGFVLASLVHDGVSSVEGRPGYIDCGKSFTFADLFSSPHETPSETIDHIACGEPLTILDDLDGFKRVRTKFDHEGFVNAYLIHDGVPAPDTQKSVQPSTNMLQAAQSSPRVGPVCQKNISFAVAQGGQVTPRTPNFVQKWIAKNGKKYPGLCFTQSPEPEASNYLLVFSTSQSAFYGLYPTVRTNTSTSTNTTPVYGSGTVTDNYGGMWNYTYNGAVTTTTTTTTTTHEDLLYTDTSNTLYLAAYDQSGREVSERWRTITTRQGGDGANTLGYNLGAALAAIHMKEHLLKNVIEDVTKR